MPLDAVDADTDSFNRVMDSFRLPKKSDEQRHARDLAIAEEPRLIVAGATAYPRVVEEVLLPIEGLLTPGHGQIISLPLHGRPPLNDVHVKAGRFPEPGRGNEVLIYEPFADAHGLRPGSTLPAILNGKLHELIIVGLAISPEFVFAIEPGGITSDDERFAPMWMSKSAVCCASSGFEKEVLCHQPANSLTLETSTWR